MLKQLLLVTIAIGALGACAAAPPPLDTAAEEAKMKADLQTWMSGMNGGAAEGVAALYADDAVLMPPNAPVATGRAAIGEFLVKESAGMKAGGITLKSTAATGIGFSGDMAWMSGTYAATDATGAVVDTGKYLSVHRKTNGAWLYIRDTWNSDTPLPPPPPPVKK